MTQKQILLMCGLFTMICVEMNASASAGEKPATINNDESIDYETASSELIKESDASDEEMKEDIPSNRAMPDRSLLAKYDISALQKAIDEEDDNEETDDTAIIQALTDERDDAINAREAQKMTYEKQIEAYEKTIQEMDTELAALKAKITDKEKENKEFAETNRVCDKRVRKYKKKVGILNESLTTQKNEWQEFGRQCERKLDEMAAAVKKAMQEKRTAERKLLLIQQNRTNNTLRQQNKNTTDPTNKGPNNNMNERLFRSQNGTQFVKAGPVKRNDPSNDTTDPSKPNIKEKPTAKNAPNRKSEIANDENTIEKKLGGSKPDGMQKPTHHRHEKTEQTKIDAGSSKKAGTGKTRQTTNNNIKEKNVKPKNEMNNELEEEIQDEREGASEDDSGREYSEGIQEQQPTKTNAKKHAPSKGTKTTVKASSANKKTEKEEQESEELQDPTEMTEEELKAIF